MTIEPGLVARLRRQIAQGGVVLFTGAGFSRAAMSVSGVPVIQVGELKQELWRFAFPSESEIDPYASLPDLYDVAMGRAGGAVKALFESRLRVDGPASPDRYRDWFAVPWLRHYTLNVDDLDEAIQATYDLPRDIKSVSALSEDLVQSSALLSIHMNGKLHEFPNVTFSVRQYGRRLAGQDPWYQTLVTDLLTHPVVFVGTQLEEPGLWQHIELRASRGAGEVELRPPSYLISPELPAPRAALLKKFNVNWIKASEEEFFEAALRGAAAESAQGHDLIRRAHHPVTAFGSLKPLAELQAATLPRGELVDFLMGRDPTWDDIISGYAVVRDFEADLAIDASRPGLQTLVLTGTAAAGKSTSAMRLVLNLEAQGRKVHVYDPVRGSLSTAQVLRAVRTVRPDVLLIDDVDTFGQGAGRLLRDLAELPHGMLTIATIRNSKLQSLPIEEELQSAQWLERTVPTLHDTDIDLLIDALKSAGRLGRMTGMTMPQRRAVFREQAGRQLIVAMFYATSGEQLEDRIRTECEDLSGAARMIYGMAALATMDHQYVTQSEMLNGLTAVGFGQVGNDVLNQTRRLVERHMLIGDAAGLKLRHRWIAERAMDFFESNGLAHKVVLAVAFAMAAQVDALQPRHTRPARVLRRLINHDRLLRMLGDVQEAREIYSGLQERLEWDPHYWLQRGSLEVEEGDLRQAKNFLESAQSLVAHPDHRVENEYAYLLLKAAARDPRAPSSVGDVEKAFQYLEETMRARGRDDPYPFHVYGSQGLAWARRAGMSGDERRLLLERLLVAVREGRRFHPKQAYLGQLERDLEKERLLTATEAPSRREKVEPPS